MPGVIVKSFVPRVKRQMSREVEQLITRTAIAYQTEVKRLMLSSPRGGRIYRVSKAGVRRPRFHKASAPGEPPAVNTAQLLKSISFKIAPIAKGIQALVGSSVKYASWLEFGTKRMAPRPAWRPALRVARGLLSRPRPQPRRGRR